MSEANERGQMWLDFLKTQPDPAAADAHFYETYSFGSTPEEADEFLAPVLTGDKTATSALAWEFEAQGKPLPEPGDYNIITDGNNEPVCVLETTQVRVVPFKEVDARFAYDYGEEARTLEWWQRAMYGYYTRVCQQMGKEASPEMLVVCENFQVVFPLELKDKIARLQADKAAS
jgi:uncharacterized protein YhfF